MQANTMFLRFADQEEAARVLASAGIICVGNEDGTLHLPCDGEVGGVCYTLDRLFGSGTLRHPATETGTFEGEDISLAAPPHGFHVNLTWDGPVPDMLLAYLAYPTTASVDSR